MNHPTGRRQFLKQSAATALLGLGAGLEFSLATLAAEQTVGNAVVPKPLYKFDATISRPILDNFLSRAITINNLSYSPFFADDCRMLNHIGAKFLGRVAYLWGQPPEAFGSPEEGVAYWRHVNQVADRLLRDDPDRILQACIFEAVFDGVDKVPVPTWAFEAFGLPVEKRNFRYKAMLFDNGVSHNVWGGIGSVPDITKPETKLWFYTRARQYIDAGYESIHLGQFGWIGARDSNLGNWKEVVAKIRAYAAQHARRHLVLLDAHVDVTRLTPAVDGRLLLDFLSYPQRPKEVVGDPQKIIIESGHADSIYGRSPGGIHPCGWTCEHSPYLVEFDQCAASGKEGQPGVGVPFIWGYEEASWFAIQNEKDRNHWLQYAADWLRRNDPNGHIEMPGSVPINIAPDGHDTRSSKPDWYRANTRGAGCPVGYSQEDTINRIWNQSNIGEMK